MTIDAFSIMASVLNSLKSILTTGVQCMESVAIKVKNPVGEAESKLRHFKQNKNNLQEALEKAQAHYYTLGYQIKEREKKIFDYETILNSMSKALSQGKITELEFNKVGRELVGKKNLERSLINGLQETEQEQKKMIEAFKVSLVGLEKDIIFWEVQLELWSTRYHLAKSYSKTLKSISAVSTDSLVGTIDSIKKLTMYSMGEAKVYQENRGNAVNTKQLLDEISIEDELQQYRSNRITTGV